MSSPEHLFKQAAECERLMGNERDEIRRSAFRLLRDMWLTLREMRTDMSPDELDRQSAALDQIQMRFLASDGSDT